MVVFEYLQQLPSMSSSTTALDSLLMPPPSPRLPRIVPGLDNYDKELTPESVETTKFFVGASSARFPPDSMGSALSTEARKGAEISDAAEDYESTSSIQFHPTNDSIGLDVLNESVIYQQPLSSGNGEDEVCQQKLQRENSVPSSSPTPHESDICVVISARGDRSYRKISAEDEAELCHHPNDEEIFTEQVKFGSTRFEQDEGQATLETIEEDSSTIATRKRQRKFDKPPIIKQFRDIIGHGQAKLRLDEALLPLALPPALSDSILTGQ